MMNRTFSKFIIMVVVTSAALCWAEEMPFSVRSLYDPISRVPGALVPFMVSSSQVTPFEILSAEAESLDSVECRAMVDPYRPKIVHLKCLGEANVSVLINIKMEGKGYRLSYGPVEIKNFDDSLVVIDPVPPPEDPKILIGKQLYTSYCIDCHRPVTDLRMKTASQIQNAVNTKSKMKFLISILTPADYQALEAYFKSIK